MDKAEREMIARLWERCRPRIASAAAQGAEEVSKLVETLIPEWCIDSEQAHHLLAHAIAEGELAADILSLWETRLRMRRSMALVPVQAASLALEVQLTERVESAGVPGVPAKRAAASPTCELPVSLRSVAETIGNYTRKKGHIALLLGRELCRAREICEETRASFSRFLVHLRDLYGLHPKTSYLYMQYSEWDFPEGLGSAAMKWIVGGFERGSAEAEQVIRAAIQEGLTLAELKSQHGTMRTYRRAIRRPQAVTGAETQQQLETEQQRLFDARHQIDTRLSDIERKLQKLRGLTLPAELPVPDESDEPRESDELPKGEDSAPWSSEMR